MLRFSCQAGLNSSVVIMQIQKDDRDVMPPAIQEATSPHHLSSNHSRVTYARPSRFAIRHFLVSSVAEAGPDSAAQFTGQSLALSLTPAAAQHAKLFEWLCFLKFSFRSTMASLPLPLAIFRSRINPSFLSLLRPMIYKHCDFE